MVRPHPHGAGARAASEEKMNEKYEDLGKKPFLQVPQADENSDKSPLDGVARLVYGFLIYRLGNKDARLRTSSRTLIATALRLNKPAVDRAVATLSAAGLVEEFGSHVGATEPLGESAGWFRRLRDPNGAWHESFVYDRVYLPRSSTTLSVRTNLLYWHLVRLGEPVDRMPGHLVARGHGKPYLTNVYLANGLGCDRRTVARGLKRLRDLRLIKIQHDGPKKFVVGVRPIGDRRVLWRDAWKPGGDTDSFPPVTAKSLFGAPSSTADPLQPAIEDQREAGLIIRGCGIRGRVAAEVVTKIVKHDLSPRRWKPLLEQAQRTHEQNHLSDPVRYPIPHCGHLFKSMLEELVLEVTAKREAEMRNRTESLPEMESRSFLDRLRISPVARRLLQEAVEQESLPLRDGGSVPCWLNWEHVETIGKEAGADYKVFRDRIAGCIFDVSGKRPDSAWFAGWMSEEPIPVPDYAPLVTLGLDAGDQKKARSHARMLAARQHDDKDPVGLARLINDLVREGCEHAAGTTLYDAERGIEQAYRLRYPQAPIW